MEIYDVSKFDLIQSMAMIKYEIILKDEEKSFKEMFHLMRFFSHFNLKLNESTDKIIIDFGTTQGEFQRSCKDASDKITSAFNQYVKKTRNSSQIFLKEIPSMKDVYTKRYEEAKEDLLDKNIEFYITREDYNEKEKVMFFKCGNFSTEIKEPVLSSYLKWLIKSISFKTDYNISNVTFNTYKKVFKINEESKELEKALDIVYKYKFSILK